MRSFSNDLETNLMFERIGSEAPYQQRSDIQAFVSIPPSWQASMAQHSKFNITIMKPSALVLPRP